MTTVILADDHTLVRQGIRSMLEAESNFEILAEASEGTQVADLVEQLNPDILIVDIMMPGLSGLEVARIVSKRSPDTRIIMLSMHANEAYVLQALRNGASAYVLKDSDTDDLLQAIADVLDGDLYLSDPLSKRAIEAYVSKAEDTQLRDPYEELTTREREILQLVAEGYTNKMIAEKLSMSPRTAETHRANMMNKLELTSQTDVIRFALKRGLLSLDD